MLTQSRKQGQPGYPQTVEEAETLLTQWKYPSRQVKQVISSDTTFATEMKPRRGNKEEEEKPMQKKFDGECYNCGKHGHMAKDCWQQKKNDKERYDRKADTKRPQKN